MTDKSANHVLIIGSIAYDSIETPTAKADFVLGGSASYSSLACSFFAPAAIASVVGNDFKDDDMRRLGARGTDTSGIYFDQNLPTFYWHGKYFDDFQNRETLDVRMGAFDNFRPALSDKLKASRYVLLGNISPQLQTHALDQVANPEFVILDTMNLWINIANVQLRELVKRVSLLILNDDEARLLTNTTNLISAGEIMMQMGADSVIIKKGEHGSMLFHKDGFFSAAAYPVKSLYDPTGAGDSYAGALAGVIAAAEDHSFAGIKKAMLTAAATASITVESFSCDKLEEVGLKEIERRAAYIREITSI